MLEIVDCEQNSDAWLAARRGLVTASAFSDMLAKQRDPKKAGMRKKLLYRLAGERLTGKTSESFYNAAMERGHLQEPEARATYDLTAKEPVTQVGFGRRIEKGVAIAGASPDSLVGEWGMLEIKTLSAERIIEVHEQGPRAHVLDHYAQTQGNLWVFNRNWIDLMLFNPDIKPVVVRVDRDDSYIATLSASVTEFNAEIEALVKRIRA